MYSALWRLLPGPTTLKVVLLIVGFFAVVALLFLVVFPEVASLLPFDRITLEPAPSPATAAG